MVRGYQHAGAGDLAAAVAFNAIVALVPTFLLLAFVIGLFLKIDQVLIAAIYSSLWGLPPGAAQDAFDAVLKARQNSGWFGALSLLGFAWVGTSFVSCLARSMNRIYGVQNCGYLCEKQRGFFVIIIFAALFSVTILASTVPTLFAFQDLNVYFAQTLLAEGINQLISYLVAIAASLGLFTVVYRIVPNAGQRIADIWPGTLTAALLFVAMAQVFPIYLRSLGGFNRYGAVFGLVSLLLLWFYLLAHLLLFGTFINSSHQRRRRRRRRGATAPPGPAPEACEA
jgi:membrane protein